MMLHTTYSDELRSHVLRRTRISGTCPAAPDGNEGRAGRGREARGDGEAGHSLIHVHSFLHYPHAGGQGRSDGEQRSGMRKQLPEGDAPLGFTAGTRIWTPDGELPVQLLLPGDLVLTADGRSAPIRWIGRRTMGRLGQDSHRLLPVRVRAHALGEELPKRDLLVSPEHGLLVEGRLVHAGALVNGLSILREKAAPVVVAYFVLELPDHALVLAEGAAAETFLDTGEAVAFDNWAEHEALPPAAAPMEALHYPRARSARQVPVATRRRLAEQAEWLAATTGDGAALA